ncbi:MAG: hypothetical protein Q7U76_08695 [Nitrospirota bacterium]|nr:hypothetical protein [Nitrospirota bacterium]
MISLEVITFTDTMKLPAHFRKFGPLALSLFLLGGCGTLSNRYGADRVESFDLTDGKSMIILSTGAADRYISFATFLRLLPEGSSGLFETALLSVDAYTMKSDFDDHHGNLYVVMVDPGNYYLSPHRGFPILAFEPPKLSL